MAFDEPAKQTESALSILTEKYNRVGAEKQAFASFRRQVADIDQTSATQYNSAANTRTVDGGTIIQSGSRTQPEQSTLSTVIELYQETVMAVDHYEEEFDETVSESIAKELNDDIAMALSCGNGFSPGLQQTICEAAETACENRSSFLDRLEDEKEALTNACGQLQDIAAKHESLTADHPVLLS